ncbi:hypothetical protein SAMN05192558_104402 [Actinokineospora alba]|uniref:Uncharacterized protein n=1 Tax=Actinokineospora alba TaxID=504798 RepID=A0A1H0M3W7_9PSEU|nr:hypothetical protein [Actinokineospora alba]TDP67573.1 hypothetical protein C8E96_3119 [Actinokineospora alba]SDI45234.1 hypothetical protein SAMN05421871_10558 [Actinokineospora alba]SDO74991.1 hypothetical protein SAMN05192558_104402 [Actinokineospora alba]
MEYQLTASLSPAPGTADLDPLQRHGVAALLDEQLDLLAGIEGPDGIEVEPLDHAIAVHPTGAVITWLVDSPALAFAEEAARHVLTEMIAQTDLLEGWTVGRCEVIATDDDLEAALGAKITEPEEEEDDEAELTEEEITALRDELLVSAATLRAFGPEAFGHDPDDPDCVISEEAARLVAGALVQGMEILTDELFADIQELEDAEGAAGDVEALSVINQLPLRYADHYGALFAKQFLVTTSILGYRLSQPDWVAPLCTAEALALHVLKGEAAVQLDLAGLLDELPIKEILTAFDEHAFADLDHERLFDLATEGEDDIDLLGTPGLDFDEWFLPRNAGPLHPYLAIEHFPE